MASEPVLSKEVYHPQLYDPEGPELEVVQTGNRTSLAVYPVIVTIAEISEPKIFVSS